ncbi:MAG: endo-1,4-beta-xylanase [Lachnospiraceae bacterium]|nr:endo-1,4-beta-xylanase [Lachnospiraceae bacterium]
MVYSESYWMSYNVNSDGSISLVYDQQYGEIKLSLPSKVDMTQCEKVVVKAQSSYAPLSIKLYDAGFNQLYVSYSNQADGVAEFELIPEGVTSAVSGIGLMSLDNVADFSKYKVTVYSVTFHMKESYTAPTAAPTKAPSSSDATLLNTYGSLFGKMGTCVSLSQLQNSTTLNHIKSQYNSVTSENEMKPDAMLGWSANLISVDAAKDLGYVIPDNYKETTVPKINFSKVDETLRICAANGLGYRAHTLVWHSQTPNWFFRTGYSASGSFVNKDVMDARMEFYIRTVMTHIHGGAYSDVVYSWDIVNEYLHADDTNWKAVYGDMGLTPTFVKKAYEIADDVLKDFGIRDKVSLIFNDFNTYMEVNEILSVVKYINSNGKICDGIGMQAHLDTGYPSPALFKDTLQSFVNAGLEVQITELDVTNKSEAEQAAYLYELMTGILQVKKNGGNITGLTFWGLADNLSWRGPQSPLLFSVFNTPKKSYYQVLEAYTDAGYKVGK